MQRMWAAVVSLLNRNTRPNRAPGQAAQLERLDGGKWTRELLMHLEWRRVEELCCAYPIGIKPLRELRGAMTSANVGEGVMVAAGRFTPEAAHFAAKENIQLIDGASLLEKLAALIPAKALALLKFATQGDFLTPTCPRCSVKMTARKSTREGRMFWGCTNDPRCKHTFSSATINPA